MSDAVLDASAVLAVLQGEAGADHVVELGSGATVSAVNLSEVVAKLAEQRLPEATIREALDELDLAVEPFDRDTAVAAGLLRPRTRDAGLSLADRACLALAERLGLPVVTADRRWAELSLPVAVRTIR